MSSNGPRYLRGWLTAFLGLFLGFYISVPAFGFTPITAPLLSAAAVTPNVMLLVDNSGSMDSIIEDSGFDSSLPWGDVYTVSRSCVLFFCTYSQGTKLGDYAFIGNLSQTYCSSGQYAFYRSSTTVTCLTLPDPRGSGLTRYPSDYLAYLIAKSNAGTPITVTSSTRMLTAISVATSLVTANRNLRIGLASFNPPSGSNPGPGGNITQAISDLSAVTKYGDGVLVPGVAQNTADNNFSALKNAIGNLSANSNTPLAETYYEITRYMRGMAPYYNSSPSTYKSPMQYRCQKNFGVVITDGLPTYDRTFPKDDPIGKSNLPNWDGVDNDGDHPLTGDAEGDSLFLDDIAKFAYDSDLRDLTTNDATGKSWNSADYLKQNMFTYAIGFTANNQMLIDTASYGHGKYYLASDSSTLTSALTSAFGDITSKAGSGGAGTVNGTTLSSSSYYYQTLYDPADWRGVINAYPITSTGAVSSTATWTTNTTMATGTTAPVFESYNTASPGAPISMVYTNFSTAQQATLSANLPSNVTGTNLVNWSKGTNITGLRTRSVLLGDIINSSLVLAAKTDQTASDLVGDSSYTTYLAGKAVGMTNSLVVNSNDGFTNVINATTGVRSYAYMPSTALASLYKVSDTGYINGASHAFLNDGPIAVYDAQVNGGWKTLALTGTGAGGKAYTAIQLYDATLGNTVKALWELRPDTSTAFANLGYAYSTPQVARLPDGTWAAFIANGYGSTKGVASLFVVNLATGALIKEIVAESSNGSNGLSTVALKVNASNVVQAAYGGDLLGQMWKFDLSNTSTASWGVAFSGKPLFTAPGGASQPITAPPLLITNTTSGKMVYFGTGKLNEVADKTTTSAQGFYAVWDADGSVGNYTVANLQPQAITGLVTYNSNQYTTTTNNTTDYTSLKGWYLPLVYSTYFTGHRVIYQASYKSARIIFSTSAVDTTDACASQGTGYPFELDALSGSMLSYPVLDTNGDGVVDSKDAIVSGIFISTGIPNLNAILDVSSTSTAPASQRKIFNDSSGTITTLVEAGGAVTTAGRIMWRQIQ